MVHTHKYNKIPNRYIVRPHLCMGEGFNFLLKCAILKKFDGSKTTDVWVSPPSFVFLLSLSLSLLVRGGAAMFFVQHQGDRPQVQRGGVQNVSQ